ncbi:hypothetical protein [Sediminicola luteus]|uniref:Alpha/beta hydrolase n=1 Tax=Sediminicola luteus TaxID=319238 RepID=A0A2A4G992_9FLAO|nr:hypothetical protein [Sediminicola luteus]PCE64556.1 hypothetical protein B7P33_09750 [Sediminicola luteus]
MKESLLIVSDMYGGQPAWLQDYIDHFETDFSVSYFDCKKEAGIPDHIQTPEEIHQYFVLGGIGHAVQKLLESETKPGNILAFSIGGTIAWKAILKGLPCTRLYCISATRLRYKTQRPDCPIRLIYGEEDTHRPSTTWFNQMGIDPTIIPNQGHTLYQAPSLLLSDIQSFFKH